MQRLIVNLIIQYISTLKYTSSLFGNLSCDVSQKGDCVLYVLSEMKYYISFKGYYFTTCNIPHEHPKPILIELSS